MRESKPKFSPDGNFVAYESNESGPLEIYVQPFPGPGGRWQVSNGGGHEPNWSPKGRELFYLNGSTLMAVTYSIDGDTFRAGAPRELFGGTFVSNTFFRWYDVFPDGEHFLVLQAAGDKELVFVVNWFEELTRLVPTGP